MNKKHILLTAALLVAGQIGAMEETLVADPLQTLLLEMRKKGASEKEIGQAQRFPVGLILKKPSSVQDISYDSTLLRIASVEYLKNRMTDKLFLSIILDQFDFPGFCTFISANSLESDGCSMQILHSEQGGPIIVSEKDLSSFKEMSDETIEAFLMKNYANTTETK